MDKTNDGISSCPVICFQAFFDPLKIHRGYRFETTVGVLLHWYSDVENDKFTLSELLNKLIKLYDKKDRGYWNELVYEVNCDDWDDDVMQEYYSKSLDSMLEKVQEDDRFINIDDYNEMLDHVEKTYGYEWRHTEKDPNLQFLILKGDYSVTLFFIPKT